MPSRTWLAISLISIVCVGFLIEAAWVRRTTSLTFDETYYLNCGLQTVHDGWIDRRIAAEGVAPLPVLLTYVPPLILAPREARPDPWTGRLNDPLLIPGPRLCNALLVGVPLIVLVFVWLLRMRDLWAASLGAGLLALSPTFVAHASIATMDAGIALWGTLALAATVWYFHHPTRRRFLLWGLSIAAAMTAKYSGVFLLPMAGLMLFFHSPSTIPGVKGVALRLKASVRRYALLLCVVVVAWWGLHGFTFTGPLKNVPLEATPADSPWVKMLGQGPRARWFMDMAHTKLKRPAPVAGVVFQYLHNQTKQLTYLNGEHLLSGRWDYFPFAFLVKSTPAELALTVFLLVLLLGSLRSPMKAWRDLPLRLQVMLLAAATIVIMMLTSNINLGHRYLISLYPILFLAGSDRLAEHLKNRRRLYGGVVLVLLCAQLIDNVSVAPRFLSYFNRLSGGSENGWKRLSDSNLDWGQDLPSLSERLQTENASSVALSYFGTALPEAYGIRCARLDLGDFPDNADLLAISVTHLQGLYTVDDAFREWRCLSPDWKAGDSIWGFRINTPARRALLDKTIHRLRTEGAKVKEQRRQAPSPAVTSDG